MRITGWVEKNQEIWKKQNLQTAAYIHIRRLLQNILDLKPLELKISLLGSRDHGSFLFQIKSRPNSPYVFPDVITPWNIFPSGRKDSPCYRGRQGRCLKELVSVLDLLEIQAPGNSLVVDWSSDSAVSVKSNNIRGDTIQIRGHSSCWKASAVAHTSGFLSGIQPPIDTPIYLNDLRITERKREATHKLKLETLIFDESGNSRRVFNDTDVYTMKVLEWEDSSIFEMGIPIETISSGCHIDVQQRVLVDSKKGVSLPEYRRNLLAMVLERQIEEMEK